MNFDVLLEGTMAGAELSALSEAVVIDVSAAKYTTSKKEFVTAFTQPIIDVLDSLTEYSNYVKQAIVNNEKNLHDKARVLNDAANMKLGVDGEKIIKTQKAIYDKIKKFRSAVIDSNYEIKASLEKETAGLKDKIKKDNNGKEPMYVVGRLYMMWYRITVIPMLKKLTKLINASLNELDSMIDDSNKMCDNLTMYVTLTKIYKFEEFLNKGSNVTKFKKNNPLLKGDEKQLDKSEGIIAKLMEKFKKLLDKIKNELNDPSIVSVAVSVGLAIGSYLILYGVVKSSGGGISSAADIKGVMKASTEILTSGSIGKRILIMMLSMLFITSVAVAGKVGFTYIKNKISGK